MRGPAPSEAGWRSPARPLARSLIEACETDRYRYRHRYRHRYRYRYRCRGDGNKRGDGQQRPGDQRRADGGPVLDGHRGVTRIAVGHSDETVSNLNLVKRDGRVVRKGSARLRARRVTENEPENGGVPVPDKPVTAARGGIRPVTHAPTGRIPDRAGRARE